MAEKLDISINGYSKIERGMSKLSLEKLEQIANIFNINVSELYSATEKGVLYLFSDNNTQSTNYYNGNESIVFENDKLKLVIEHQKELIKQKEKEIKVLEEIIELLKKDK